MKELTITIKIESMEDIQDDEAAEVAKALVKNIAQAINRQIDESEEGLFGNDNSHFTRSFAVISNELNYDEFVDKSI